MSKQVMEQALEALEEIYAFNSDSDQTEIWEMARAAIAALKEAIKQAGEVAGYKWRWEAPEGTPENLWQFAGPSMQMPRDESLVERIPLYTAAPSIPAGWQLAKTEDIEFCVDAIANWGAYASEYFQEKWNLEGDIDRAKNMLSAAPSE